MAKQSEWPGKMLAVIKTGNVAAAVAQIKVAPSVKDLRQLQSELDKAGLRGRWRELDLAIEENMALLNAPRLHRSP
ncbi:hypothetical protein AZ34_09530 [Hylemonella gracilis str. Niagara R]|uniref:Uncharacterized protein n=1 Tax=Hylemonella gracilis str. Niagara R TaxID=1458275 RepID=A0A016XHG9_9BURK|nr:hypothetical protein [Hylemonella gracilis]EYC51301.1 hypothetical protein AZ34_09530 [Hylemonella gracilis str. Niagara R]